MRLAMKNTSLGDAFLADITSLEEELKRQSNKLTGRIATLQKQTASYEAKFSDAIKSRDSAKSKKLSNKLSQNKEETNYYEKSLQFIDLQSRLIHAIGVNFRIEYDIDPKLATTNALEKLMEFEDALKNYRDSVVAKDMVGSAVVLLERSKIMVLKYAKYGVEYTPINVGEQRSQAVEPVINLKKEDIKYMTFSGGGAKGTAYGGVLQALSDNDILPNIEGVAGSSAGSMMAAFTAAGVSVAETLALLKGLTKEVIEKNLDDYVEKGIKTSIVNYIYFESCKPNRFTGSLDSIIAANPDKSPEILETLFEIYAAVSSVRPVTFGDIAKLHKIDPKKFKHLHITATNTTTNKLEIFSSETLDKDSNVSVARACLASSALPLVRPAETIKGQKYKDGGILDNNPRDCFKNRPGRTLAFYFPSKARDKAIRGDQEYSGEKGLMWKLEKLATKSTVTGFQRSGDLHELSVEKQFYDVLNNPFETIIIDTGRVGTVDFKKGTKQMDYLLVKGEIQTQQYLNNVVNDITPDYTLDFRSVLLKAYEISMRQKELPGVPKVKFHLKPETPKSPEGKLHLLDYCKKSKWENAIANNVSGQIKEVVTYLMQDCFQDLNRGKQHKLAKILTQVLNDTECPLKVKEAFIKGLNLSRAPDVSNIANHTIKAEDFEPFITGLNRGTVLSR